METLETNQDQIQEGNEAAKFEGISRDDLIEKIKAKITPEQASVLTNVDFDLIIGLARQNLEDQKSETIEDALEIGTAKRLKARPGASPLEVALDEQGNVIGSGQDRISAMRKGQDAKKE